MSYWQQVRIGSGISLDGWCQTSAKLLPELMIAGPMYVKLIIRATAK